MHNVRTACAEREESFYLNSCNGEKNDNPRNERHAGDFEEHVVRQSARVRLTVEAKCIVETMWNIQYLL